MSEVSGRLWAIGEVTSRSIRSLPEMAAGIKVLDLFGSNTFDVAAMKQKLPKPVFESLQETIRRGQQARPRHRQRGRPRGEGVGARQGRHPLLPLVPAPDRPHRREARRLPDLRRRRPAHGALQRRAAHPERARRLELPLGRHAHHLRGPRLHGLGPSSPIFIVDGPNGKTLCVPSVFISYHGDALDNKTPLLRSMEYLSEQALAVLRLFGDNTRHARRAHPGRRSRSTSSSTARSTPCGPTSSPPAAR